MDLSILVSVCGWPLLAILGVLSAGLSLMACFLYFKVRQQLLLTSFLPLTLIPVFPGLCFTVVRFLSTIQMQVDQSTEVALDAGFVMQMNLVPLLIGMLAACLPAGITILGRWHLAWKAAGIELMPQKSDEQEGANSDDWEKDEAADYIDSLVRPR